jgi:protein tyrosine phosphatase (PTP) superfamily phosphohydrolase (DUF442 family)
MRLVRNRWFLAALAAPTAAILAAGAWVGYVKVVRGNFGTVVPGQVYRSAYPSHAQLREWSRERGLRSILCLMSHREADSLDADRALAAELGLERVEVPMKVTRIPRRPELLRLVEALESAPRPLLLHCNVGADRTGVASVMAAMAIGGQSFDVARRQLTLRHLHVRAPVADILTMYESHCHQEGRPTGGWASFRDWLLTSYQPDYYYVTYEIVETGRGAAVVRITNETRLPIPLSTPGRRLVIQAESQAPDGGAWILVGERELVGPDLEPGGTLETSMELDPKNGAIAGAIRFDLVESERTRFSDRGSPVGFLRIEHAR